MIIHFKYHILISFLFFSIRAQHTQIATEVATAGAFLGGRMGTHAIHSNPALLGVKSGETIERTLIDTFTISYGVKLALSDNEEELEEIKNKLNQDGFERDYTVIKEDSLFSLNTYGFKDSFSAFNFSSNLPVSIPLKIIHTDTTWETIEKPKIQYKIQLFATPHQDSLKSFKESVKIKLKDFQTKVVFKDSLFKYFVDLSSSEEEAVMLKNSPTIQSISEDAFVVSYDTKVPDGFVPKFSITLPIRFTINMQNNYINTNWFNQYISADMVQNPTIKNDLLSSVPSSGISSSFGLNTAALDMTYLNYGFSLFNINAYYKLSIPKELTQLIFDGIRFDEPLNISNFDTRGLVYNETTFSYGRKLDFKQLPFATYVGFGVRYFNGLFSYTESYEGMITTKEDSVNIFSDMKVVFTDLNQIASGFGLDLGVYGQVNEKLSVQLSLVGLGSYLKSKEVSSWKSINNISISNDDITEILDYNDTQIDSINETFTIIDTTEKIKNISINLPAHLNIAGSYKYSNNFHLKGAIKYITDTDFIGRIAPKISLGAEIFPSKRYPLLVGISLGGINKITFGGGFGIKIKKLFINFAASQSGGLFNSATGSSISSDFRFFF